LCTAMVRPRKGNPTVKLSRTLSSGRAPPSDQGRPASGSAGGPATLSDLRRRVRSEVEAAAAGLARQLELEIDALVDKDAQDGHPHLDQAVVVKADLSTHSDQRGLRRFPAGVDLAVDHHLTQFAGSQEAANLRSVVESLSQTPGVMDEYEVARRQAQEKLERPWVINPNGSCLHVWGIEASRLTAGSPIPFFLLHPVGSTKALWDTVVSLLVVYDAFVLPYRFCFEIPARGLWRAFEDFETIFFLVDLLVSLLTGYRHPGNGNLVVDPWRCFLNYAAGWLIFDALIAFPFQWVVDVGTSGRSPFASLRVFRYARLIKVVRMTKIIAQASKATLDACQSSVSFHVSKGLVRLCISALLPCHLSACFWYALGIAAYHAGGDCWLDNLPAEQKLTLPAPDQHIHGQVASEMYQVCVYFVLTTMTTVGYGDLGPRNVNERLFAMGLLVQCMVVFSTFLGVLNSVLVDMYSESSYARQQLIKLIRYLHWRKVPATLRASIVAHMQHNWEQNHVHLSHEENVCSQLSPSLRVSLMEHVFGPVLTQAPFLCWMHGPAVREVCYFASTKFYQEGDIVIGAGEVVETIFCLTDGSVRVKRSNAEAAIRSESDRQLSWLRAGTQAAGELPPIRPSTSRLFRVSRRHRDVEGSMLGTEFLTRAFQNVVSLEVLKHDEGSQLRIGQQHYRSYLQRARSRVKPGAHYHHHHEHHHHHHHHPVGPGEHRAVILHAPGFFNESVLWNLGIDERVPAVPSEQACVALQRSEFVCVERGDIAAVAKRYPRMELGFESMRHLILLECQEELENRCAVQIAQAWRRYRAARRQGRSRTPGIFDLCALSKGSRSGDSNAASEGIIEALSGEDATGTGGGIRSASSGEARVASERATEAPDSGAGMKTGGGGLGEVRGKQGPVDGGPGFNGACAPAAGRCEPPSAEGEGEDVRTSLTSEASTNRGSSFFFEECEDQLDLGGLDQQGVFFFF